MSTNYNYYRQRGFQLRRVAFALKVMSALWIIPMVGLYLSGKTWMHFLAALTGFICFSAPSLLLAAGFDQLAENKFGQYVAAKNNQALLGVVYPNKN